MWPRRQSPHKFGNLCGLAHLVHQHRHKRPVSAELSPQDETTTVFTFSERYMQWDQVTTKLAASSTLAFLLYTLPQIVNNVQNLVAGTTGPIAILPWMGYTTGLIGNTLLLSYFVPKKEIGATVQGVGALTTFALLTTVYLAGFMPQTAFLATSAFTFFGVALNALRFGDKLPLGIWSSWLELSGLVGLAILPQVAWSTFSSQHTFLPGIVSATTGLLFILLLRLGLLPSKLRTAWTSLSGWTATLLFIFMGAAQLWSGYTSPENLGGISLLTVLLGTAGNALMVPRALFTRDAIWFTGSAWGCLIQGWSILLTMALNNVLDKVMFGVITVALLGYLGYIFKNDANAHNKPSVFETLYSLFLNEL